MKLLIPVMVLAALPGVAVAQTSPAQAPVVLSPSTVPAVPTTPVFNDVPPNHWAFAAVQRLASAGIIEGYGAHDALATRTVAEVTPPHSPSAKMPTENPAKKVAKIASKNAAVGAKTENAR